MSRKVVLWLLTLTACLFMLPLGTCVRLGVDGGVQSFEPCDVLNCVDPSFLDPCRFLECGRPIRAQTWGESSTSSSGG